VCLFTKGWNIYNPDSLPVWHHYTRNIAGRENPSVGHLKDKAILRLKYILGVVEAKSVPRDFLRDLDPYLLGSVRSREDYFAYAGIDWVKKPIVEPFCVGTPMNSPDLKTRYKHHYETLPNLLPLNEYYFDTAPTVPPRFRSTAAPLEQALAERKQPKNVLLVAEKVR
jgi:hypothetical protein